MASIYQQPWLINQVRKLKIHGDWPTYVPNPIVAQYGYFAGGQDGPRVNIIDRIQFSNDTVNTIDRGDLTVARSGLFSVNNSSAAF